MRCYNPQWCTVNVVTRFAPSPTGILHIGSARTALFSWLYARKNKGKFYLRIEDTDLSRSHKSFEEDIFHSLSWLGLNWDEEVVYQSKRFDVYTNIANSLLSSGKAYKCYCQKQELSMLRSDIYKRYDRRCRDINQDLNLPYAVRLKVPELDGTMEFVDLIQGQVSVKNSELDDMIIIRSDGTPTYMFAVVVDDHEYGITHVIRGDEHLMNAFRQIKLYDALGWNKPEFGHIPVIHGPDSKKLSKRHGATGIAEYKKSGILPSAMVNYLTLLGLGQKNQDLDYDSLSVDHIIEIFDINHINIAPAKFDYQKLLHINTQHIRASNDLISVVIDMIGPVSEESKRILERAIDLAKVRAESIDDLLSICRMFIDRPVISKDDIKPFSYVAADILSFISAQNFDRDSVDKFVAHSKTMFKFKEFAECLRTVLVNRSKSPSIQDLLYALGKEESIYRMKFAVNLC